MNTESLLKQFDLVETSIHRARLPFETNMLQEPVLEVTLYELIKSREQILNMIREIDPNRFGVKVARQISYPEPSVEALSLCPNCGDPNCGSDHK